MAENVFSRPEFIHIFTNDKGEQWMYDYQELRLTQINVAAELFEFHYQRKANPPARESDLKVGGGHLLMRSCFAYCLIPMEDGKPLPFDFEKMEERAEEAKKFIDSLSAEHQMFLERCRKDFFLGPNELSLLESATRSKRFVNDTREALSVLMGDTLADAKRLQNEFTKSPNSTNPEPSQSERPEQEQIN